MKSDDRLKLKIDKDFKRADDFLKRAGFSHSLIKRSFRGGRVKREGEILFRTSPLKAGDRVIVEFAEESSDLSPSPFRQNILFEDEDLLVIEKGVIPSMPCRMYPTETLANEIAGYFDSIGLKRKVRMLGRLDKETTGVMVVCKNPFAYLKLLDRHTQSKTYVALVRGKVAERGTVDAPMGPGDTSLVRVVRKDGQRAVTHYAPLEIGENSLLELTLETGRCHQIRCHMAYIGHPIVGDELYGGGKGGVHLHVASVDIFHPRTGKAMTFRSEVPKDFMNGGGSDL